MGRTWSMLPSGGGQAIGSPPRRDFARRRQENLSSREGSLHVAPTRFRPPHYLVLPLFHVLQSPMLFIDDRFQHPQHALPVNLLLFGKRLSSALRVGLRREQDYWLLHNIVTAVRLRRGASVIPARARPLHGGRDGDGLRRGIALPLACLRRARPVRVWARTGRRGRQVGQAAVRRAPRAGMTKRVRSEQDRVTILCRYQ